VLIYGCCVLGPLRYGIFILFCTCCGDIGELYGELLFGSTFICWRSGALLAVSNEVS